MGSLGHTCSLKVSHGHSATGPQPNSTVLWLPGYSPGHVLVQLHAAAAATLVNLALPQAPALPWHKLPRQGCAGTRRGR